MATLKTLGSLDLRDGDGRVASSVLSPQLTALLVYLSGPARAIRAGSNLLRCRSASICGDSKLA